VLANPALGRVRHSAEVVLAEPIGHQLQNKEQRSSHKRRLGAGDHLEALRRLQGVIVRPALGATES